MAETDPDVNRAIVAFPDNSRDGCDSEALALLKSCWRVKHLASLTARMGTTVTA